MALLYPYNLCQRLFSEASSLDNLSSLFLGALFRSEAMISALVAYLSRAQQLERLLISFVEQDADLSTSIKAIVDKKTVKTLSFNYNVVQENDSVILFDLISNTRSINDLKIRAVYLKEEDFSLALKHVEKNESIVRLHLSAHGLLHVDYERIATSISKSRTVNHLHLFVNDGFGNIDVDMDSVDKMFEVCSNLDRLTVGKYQRTRSRGDEVDLKYLIRFSRTFAGSKMTRDSRLPRELFSIMLYEGFKHLNWFDGQLSTVIRALLDRRTIGIIAGDFLPLSRPYVYVRCRDALEKIAN